MATDDVDKYKQGRETIRHLEALRVSTATKGGGSLTPEVKNQSTETPLGAVCHCTGVFTSSFFRVVFCWRGADRGKGGTLSTNMSMQVTLDVRPVFAHELAESIVYSLMDQPLKYCCCLILHLGSLAGVARREARLQVR